MPRVVRRELILGIAAASFACRDTAPAVDAGPALAAAIDRTAARHPPPLRAAHPPAPTLPDLPSLGAHEAASAPPPNADLAAAPCRSVWTGSAALPLACARSLLFGPDDGGAVDVVPRALLHRDLTKLPAIVDHRLDGTEGPVRNQTTAPACTAFAAATAIDHALARWAGRAAPVSVMQIWSRYHSPHEGVSLSANIGLALAPDALWPFDARVATSWVPCSEFDVPVRGACGKPIDIGLARRAEQQPVGEFTEVEYLGVPSTDLLATKIAAGQDIVVTLELPASFVPKGRPGARYVPHWSRSAGADAGHALVLAGYVHLPHATYFLAHNSWGAAWGDGGYAWLHEATLKAWMREAVAVDAEPVDRDQTGRPLRSRGERTCGGGLVIDSISGKCASACPDASPRHDGVCAVAGQCPDGMVNLTGTCVLAAPVSNGRDPKTGVSWQCGPGGCAYEMPREADPTCTGNRCKASCPAPDFHIARMGNALVCVE